MVAGKGTAPSPMHHTSASPLSLPSGAPSAAAEGGVASGSGAESGKCLSETYDVLALQSRRLENGVTSVGGPHLSHGSSLQMAPCRHS